MSALKFRSRIDAWFVMLFIVSYLGVLTMLALKVESTETLIVVALVFLVSSWLPLWILLSTSYSVGSKSLDISCGPVSERIELASIRRVRRVRSLWAAPALSLRRIAIDFGDNRRTVISPRDEAAFVAALLARVPKLEIAPELAAGTSA